MSCLKENGVSTIIEIGPGKVLTGLAKRELRPERSLNLDTMDDVRQLVAAGV
jgi:malonyl CoA-acyl carrier protein transacylase